ncbi:hypothetical protein FKJ79_21965, partial [Klebsiella pneumoniae]|nr:hypothetical protein [Klebsiella pneumoniae]
LHGDVLMWLMKTLLTSGCTNQRGAGHRGYRSSATCWPRGHQCRKVTDVNRSLLQPAAHTSNSITDTVAPDRPFQSALSP